MGGYSRSFRGSLKGRRGAEGGKLVAPRPGGAKGQEEASALANGKRLNSTPGVGGGAGAVGGRQGGQEALLLGGYAHGRWGAHRPPSLGGGRSGVRSRRLISPVVGIQALSSVGLLESCRLY